MWGSTTPNTASECTWANAPFNNGSSKFNSTYFNSVKGTVCPNNVLAKEYDAAAQIMGGDWRMPTQTECQELLSDTTNEWATNYNGTGVNGWKFTSKTNGNSIFIPASGTRPGSSFYRRGNYGYVWSSSLNITSPINALYLNFTSNGLGADGHVFRDDGVVVRGVL